MEEDEDHLYLALSLCDFTFADVIKVLNKYSTEKIQKLDYIKDLESKKMLKEYIGSLLVGSIDGLV